MQDAPTSLNFNKKNFSRKFHFLFTILYSYVISFTIAYRIIPREDCDSSLPIRILVSSHSSRTTSWYPGKEYDVGENKLTPTFPVYGRFVSRFLINEGSDGPSNRRRRKKDQRPAEVRLRFIFREIVSLDNLSSLLSLSVEKLGTRFCNASITWN